MVVFVLIATFIGVVVVVVVVSVEQKVISV